MKFRLGLGLLASLVGMSLLTIIVFLAVYSWPAVRLNGLSFITSNTWNIGGMYADPIVVDGQRILPGAHYGILFLIVGTLLTTAISLILAIPLGIGAAVFLAEGIPPVLQLWLSFFVELLAAIPSVVYGLWGYIVLIPTLSHHVFPHMVRYLGFIPVFGGPAGSGYGLLTASLVLTLMIVPLITATLRDALAGQTAILREGALALGASHFETIRTVQLPALRRVIIGSTILATGRALGETMAVLMVSGNALNYLPHNIYGPISTMASFIVSQLDSAMQDPTGMAVRSLAEIALVLCLISILVNALARILISADGPTGSIA